MGFSSYIFLVLCVCVCGILYHVHYLMYHHHPTTLSKPALPSHGLLMPWERDGNHDQNKSQAQGARGCTIYDDLIV
jgi:hypothetical protein